MDPINCISSIDKQMVSDINFDWFGRRLAVARIDKNIVIYDIEVNENGRADFTYNSEYSLSQYGGTIWKLKWCHPDFGNMIATCSYDKHITLWEEKKKKSQPRTVSDNKECGWKEKWQVFENKACEDIKFCPRGKGFKLGAGFSDGYVTILNGQNGKRMTQFKVSEFGINSISWNKNSYDCESMQIAAKDANTPRSTFNGSKIGDQDNKKVYEENEISTHKKQSGGNPLSLWYYKDEQWHCGKEFEFNGKKHLSGVLDVSWAQQNGRSYHTAVSGSRDGVFVWKFTLDNWDHNGELNVTIRDLKVFSLDEQEIPIRVTWNFMTTIIVVSLSNGSLSIWKRNFDNNWERIRCLTSNVSNEFNVHKQL